MGPARVPRGDSHVGRPFKCPYCGSHDNVAKGLRRTKDLGPRRIRRCKGCRRKFTPKHQAFLTLKNAIGTKRDAGLPVARAGPIEKPAADTPDDEPDLLM